MKYTFIWVLLGALCLTHISHAGQTKDIPGRGKVPYQMLFEEWSKQGESLDQFAVRISPKLRAFADKTGFESCGDFASDGDRYGVVIGTNSSHVGCVVFGDIVPKGTTSIETTIHSHGVNRSFMSNKSDRVIMKDRLPPGDGILVVGGQILNKLSEADLKGGKGYLAAPGEVFYHDGNRNVRRVGP